jgi:hypothetical protein
VLCVKLDPCTRKGMLSILALKLGVTKVDNDAGYSIYFIIIALCVKLDPCTRNGMHSILALKLGVTKVVIRLMLIVGRKFRID